MRFIFTLLFMVLASGSYAQSYASAPYHFTGQELGQYCNSDYDTDYGICAGYVTGLADVLLQQDVYGTSACNHKNVKSEQLINLVKVYLESNPEAAYVPARDVVSLTLSRAFPCN